MFRRSLVASLVCGLGVLGLPTVTTAATAATGSPVVLDVPANTRFEPRTTRVVGQTTDQGLLVRQELDPTTGAAGAMADALVAADGTGTPVAGNPQSVLGNRLVDSPASGSVTSRVLPDGQPTTLPIPTGYSLLDYTGDGVVLSSGSYGSESLWLLPWSGGDPLSVAGLPSGWDVSSNAYGTGYVHDATGTVIRAYDSAHSTSVRLLVDTTMRQVWQLDGSGTNCGPGTGTTWALNDGTVAWQNNGTGGRVICTEQRPASASDAIAPATARAAVDLPVSNQWSDVSLLPVGDYVVVWRTTAGARDQAPVYSVDAAGTPTTILGWGHDVAQSGPGQVVAVGGPSAQETALRTVTMADRSTRTLAAIAPVVATISSLAVDDGRLVAMDNSALGDAVVQHLVSFDTSQVDGSTTLDTGVTDRVVAGGGETAWEKKGAWALRDANGDITTSYLGKSSVPVGTRAVSGQWVLYDDNQVLDTATNTLAAPVSSYDSARQDLVAGVLYLHGGAVNSAIQDRVVMRDLATGLASSTHLTGCLNAGTVQAAGSWLMAPCRLGTDGSTGYVVMDRTHPTGAYTLPNDVPLMLGNGFAVRRNADGSLDWHDLTDTTATWQPLAGPGGATVVAVGKGTEASVAWTDGHHTHVATLPVTVTADPPPPSDVARPTAPQVTLTPFDSAIGVRWVAAAASEQITGYTTSGIGSSRYFAPTGTSTVYSGLSNGSSYTVTVTATNIAGRTSTTGSAVPLAPPAAPGDVQASVDPVTSRVEVSWTWAAAAKSESLTGFRLGAGGQTYVDGLAPDARSASFTMPAAWTGPVTVTAVGTHQVADGTSADVAFPGLDTTAPTSSLARVRRVLLRRSLSIAVHGADDRKLAGIDVRRRSAGFGRRLGSWSRPAAWQGLPPGRLKVSGLNAGGTYCFSSRAHDAAGNVSRWTAPACTAVALDDRALSRTRRWKSVSGSGYYRSTASRAVARYAALTHRWVHASSVWLVATTCPTCGTVTVFSGNTSFDTISLRTPVRHTRRLIKVTWPMRTGGTLKLVTWPRWGPVTIDAVAVRDY